MANIRTLPYPVRKGDIYFIGECSGRGEFGRVTNLSLWKEAKSASTKSSRKAQKGDSKMYEYQFKYKGGAKKIEQANYKFFIFVVDGDAAEHHLYGGLKNGLVERKDILNNIYYSASSIIKVFTSTSGFGVPKEYFSYFVVLSPSSSKLIHIKPLGFKALTSHDWGFAGRGRFMKKEEIMRFFGTDSNTWKFYSRQSFLSRFRLSELVTISESQGLEAPVEKTENERLRMVRFD